jgi:Na+-translocating membrane potential-generating system (MpsC)
MLTKGEQSLVNKGRADKVLEIRHEFQGAMREESMARISQLTGRRVVAMLSANHVDPDLGAEIFVLDGPSNHVEPPAIPTDGAPAPASDGRYPAAAHRVTGPLLLGQRCPEDQDLLDVAVRQQSPGAQHLSPRANERA